MEEIIAESVLLDEKLANSYLGYNGVFIYNLLNKIDYEIPYISKLKRGKYMFKVDDALYELYQGTFNKMMYNSYGKEYNQKQKGWGTRLVEGEDKFDLETIPSENNTNKDEIIERHNRKILQKVLSPFVTRENKIKLYEEKDFEDAFNKATKDDKIKALQMQIELMDDGWITKFALPYVYGYIPIKSGVYDVKFVHKDTIADYRKAKRQKKIDKGIRGRGIRITLEPSPIRDYDDITDSI